MFQHSPAKAKPDLRSSPALSSPREPLPMLRGRLLRQVWSVSSNAELGVTPLRVTLSTVRTTLAPSVTKPAVP
eukprot:scaffold137_cov398-Prasinococcus_capsulatus_cf.AAC.32